MSHTGRATLTAAMLLSAALWLLNSCGGESTPAQAASVTSERFEASPARAVLSGTRIRVALAVNLSSGTASAGDTWRGSVTENVRTLNGGIIPAGSAVEGVVAAAISASHGARAMLELGVQSIRVNGLDEAIAASAEPVLAGSPLARDDGASLGSADGAGRHQAVPVAGGASFAVPLGGSPAVGGVSSARRHQVVLSDGTVMSFTVSHTVAMR